MTEQAPVLTPPTAAPSRSGFWRPLAVALGLAIVVVARCASVGAGRRGEEIVACGRTFAAGTPVVLWSDDGGYNAYERKKRFETGAEPDGKLRYAPLRGDLPAAIAARVARAGWRLPDLQQVVHLFVVHFDAAGTSRQCFKILQDRRNLSVHFLLDLDGTIYQTLDLQEHAWHATIANSASIGVEIAHPGCLPDQQETELLRWYVRDDRGYRLELPGGIEHGVRTPGFVARPARPEPIGGAIHGRRYRQFDFTPEQYEALARLCAALNRVLPRIRLEVPRAPDGSVRTTRLTKEELLAFDGIVGHFHVQDDKTDPGPAFQWDRLLARARELRAGSY